MGKFGNRLRQEKIQEWNEKYIDYDGITSFIKNQRLAFGERPMPKMELINKLHEMLDKNLKTFYMFFVSQERELYVSMNSRLHIRRAYGNLDENGIKSELLELEKIMDFAIKITRYVRDNIQALHRLLHKIDKNFQHFNIAMKYTYVLEKMEMKNSDLMYIFNFKMVNEVCALCDDMRQELLDYFPLAAGSISIDGGEPVDGPLLQKEINSTEANKIEYPEIDVKTLSKSILNKLDDNDSLYKDIYSIYRTWDNILKFDQYFTDQRNASKKIEDTNASTASRITNMSNKNKWNINLTLIQKWYMALCFTIIFPDAYYMLNVDVKEGQSLSGLIIGMTSLGGIISIVVTKYWLNSSYKMPMIVSSVLSLLGNVAYILGIGYDSLILLCVSRLLIGFALNARVHRRYLLEYIPKRKIGKYMLYFKISYLSGLASGPLLTLIMSFIPETGKKTKFPFAHYTAPSWVASFGAIVLLIFVIAGYTEPVSNDFNVFAGDTNIEREATRGNSFLLESSLTNKESDALKQLNEKLFQFNAENNYSDTNQVSQYVDELMERELGPSGSIQKAFGVIILEVFLADFIIMSLFCLVPVLFNERLQAQKTKEEVMERIIALSITIPLILLVPLYFVNYFYVSTKIDQRIYLIILSCLTGILGFVGRIFIENVPVLTYLLIFLIIFSYILEDTNIYFFTKMIPSDFEVLCMHGDTFVHLSSYIGQMGGCFIIIIGYAFRGVKDRFEKLGGWMLIVESSVIILSAILYIIFYRTFKDKSILRLIRAKDNRKIRRTEF